MHALSVVYDQAFPCPVYTQSRAYWVWARCTNDGKHSQPKRDSNPWHLSYRLRSLTTRTPSPKCLMHMLTLQVSESTQVFKWNFANSVTVCYILKWQLTPSYLVTFYFSQFSQLNASSMECMSSHLKAFLPNYLKKHNNKFELSLLETRHLRMHFWGDAWTKIENLLCWPPKNNLLILPFYYSPYDISYNEEFSRHFIVVKM